MKRLGHAIALICLMLLPCRQAHGEWMADIVDMEWSPPRFVAVDKKAQSFALLARQSPLRVMEAIPCATGQELGDKFKEGDLKTPEGVYFITRRKSSGLNYELYGDLAFPLNFPNPADVLRRKSGHGIWIHGRGHSLIPFETQGCVALSTPDIHRMDTSLAEGMPVVIADEIRMDGNNAAKLRLEAREVVEATNAWAKAWQDRSETFFGFHDAEKFSITEGEPFAAFRSHKERLFKALPWIQVTLSNVRAIAGPDYWVTYFVQVYRSPTLISQGLKRLYWQRGADGRFRIIGMEYEEMPVTMADKGKTKGKTLAMADEVEADTRLPDSPSEEEVQVRQLVDSHQAVMEKMAQKAFHNLTLTRQPSPEDQAILDVAQIGATKPGVSPFASDAMKTAPPAPATPTTLAQAPAQPAAPAKEAAPEKAAPPATPAPVVAAKAQAPAAATAAGPASVKTPAVSPEHTAAIVAMAEGWRSAWERGHLSDYLAFYSDDARQGNLKGKAAIGSQKTSVWQGRVPDRVGITVVAVAPEGDGYTVVCAETYQGKGGRENKGFKILSLVPTGKTFLITKERWSKFQPDLGASGTILTAAAASATPQAQAAAQPAPPIQEKASAPAPAQAAVPTAAAMKTPAPVVQAPTTATAPVVTGQIPVVPVAPAVSPARAPVAAAEDRLAAATAMVETWRDAWERGRVNEYAAFYAEGAVQGDRRGRQAIREQKAELWKDKTPKRVALSDIKITPRKDGFTVTCVQDYESRDGSADRGKKTLYLAPSGSGFSIVEEKWSRM
jgi:murein L,D-transpeptidase YafK